MVSRHFARWGPSIAAMAYQYGKDWITRRAHNHGNGLSTRYAPKKKPAHTYRSNALAAKDRAMRPTITSEGHLKTFTDIKSTKHQPSRAQGLTLRTRVVDTIAAILTTQVGEQAVASLGPVHLDQATLAGLGNPSGYLYVYSNRITTNIANNSNGQIVVDVYDFVCKAGTNQTPPSAFNSGAGLSPDGIGIANGWATIGVNPLAIPNVTDYWKCEGHHNLIINPGVLWVHEYKRTPKKLIPGRTYESSLNEDFIPGVSMNTMIVARGCPINTVAGGVTPSGGQELIWYQTESLKWQLVDNTDDRQVLAIVDSLPRPVAPYTKMLDETEVPATIQNA